MQVNRVPEYGQPIPLNRGILCDIFEENVMVFPFCGGSKTFF